MQKNFILDTNVLLHDPFAIGKFADNHVIIPIEVLEELDHFKRDVSDLGTSARRVAKDLDDLRQKGRLGEGVPLPEGGTLRVFAGDYEDMLNGTGLSTGKKTANRILSLAVYLHRHEPDRPTILVTKNINLRLKADALGIRTEDYEEPRSQERNHNHGFCELSVPAEVLRQFQQRGTHTFTEGRFAPNEYVLLRDAEGTLPPELGRITDREGVMLQAIDHRGEGVLGIRPLNVQQCFAFDALLNDDIKLVTLMGKAGTGKTLLAVAAGLHKVLKEDKYHKLLISRPVMPLGRDIGFIPGEIMDKLRPWMQPIYDAIELLQEVDRRTRSRALPPDILEGPDVAVEPLTYIRGRSIPHQYMIIDEAQNLTPLEVKTIITRVGFGTKIVLTGDPGQIDNPYIDSASNGLVYLANRFRKEVIAAHLTLTKGERSELAEIAANVL